MSKETQSKSPANNDKSPQIPFLWNVEGKLESVPQLSELQDSYTLSKKHMADIKAKVAGVTRERVNTSLENKFSLESTTQVDEEKEYTTDQEDNNLDEVDDPIDNNLRRRRMN